MVKSALIFVILVIGYGDVNRVVARVPNDVEVFSDTLMSREDELLPSRVEEDYANDEAVGEVEGSGFAPPEAVGALYVPDLPSVEDGDFSKEQDQQTAVDENNNQEDEEDLNVAPIIDDEPSEGVKTDGEIADEVADTSKMQDELDEPAEPSEEDKGVDEDNTSKTGDVNVRAPHDTSEIQETPEEPTDESIAEELIDQSRPISEEKSLEASDTIKEVNTNGSEDISDQSQQQSLEAPDTIKEINTNESENITDNEDDINKDSIEVVDDNDDKMERQQVEVEDNKEEQALEKVELPKKFPNEKDLPAERIGDRARGFGRSMPMQDGARTSAEATKNGGEEVDKKIEADQHNHETDEDSPVEKQSGDDLQEQPKEMEESGASSASSGSNAVTFVVILGIVCLVAIIGYFVHRKRKSTQRATAVPTHEDKELKEVRTIDSDDGFNGQRQASHIPEANPLILTNSHFKRNVEMAAQEQQLKNGHVPTDQQQQALLTTILATATKPKDADDIRMMDDDVEEEGAERRPLVMSTFKPTVQISGSIAINVGKEGRAGGTAATTPGED